MHFVRSHLPFSDQYSRCLSVWRPDGRALLVPLTALDADREGEGYSDSEEEEEQEEEQEEGVEVKGNWSSGSHSSGGGSGGKRRILMQKIALQLVPDVKVEAVAHAASEISSMSSNWLGERIGSIAQTQDEALSISADLGWVSQQVEGQEKQLEQMRLPRMKRICTGEFACWSPK